jgi:hypothetical protein
MVFQQNPQPPFSSDYGHSRGRQPVYNISLLDSKHQHPQNSAGPLLKIVGEYKERFARLLPFSAIVCPAAALPKKSKVRPLILQDHPQ